MQVKLGKKQNKLTVDGVKYKAVPYPGCTGCDLTPGQCDDLHKPSHGLDVYGGLPCTSSRRLDERSVIWVRVKQQPEDDVCGQ